MPFQDRREAGRQLAVLLADLQASERAAGGQSAAAVVLGLPRGGVVVAAEVARAMNAPLDVILVRKLGVPSQPELAMGALGEDGVRLLDPELVRRCGVTAHQLAAVERHAAGEIQRQAAAFRPHRAVSVSPTGPPSSSTTAWPPEPWRGRPARSPGAGAAAVVLAVPWRRRAACAVVAGGRPGGLREAPHDLVAVGQSYRDFTQTSDEEVIELGGGGAVAAGAWRLGRGRLGRPALGDGDAVVQVDVLDGLEQLDALRPSGAGTPCARR